MKPLTSAKTNNRSFQDSILNQCKVDCYKTISKPKDLKSPVLDEMDKNLRRIKTAFQELEMFK